MRLPRRIQSQSEPDSGRLDHRRDKGRLLLDRPFQVPHKREATREGGLCPIVSYNSAGINNAKAPR